MQSMIRRLLPFFMLCIFIVIFAFGFILLAYLFLIGSLIGVVLFAFRWIRSKWQQKNQPPNVPNAKSSRIIDITDWKRH